MYCSSFHNEVPSSLRNNTPHQSPGNFHSTFYDCKFSVLHSSNGMPCGHFVVLLAKSIQGSSYLCNTSHFPWFSRLNDTLLYVLIAFRLLLLYVPILSCDSFWFIYKPTNITKGPVIMLNLFFSPMLNECRQSVCKGVIWCNILK